MKRKTVEEREADLKELREQIKKMQGKAREMAKRNKVQERKERTKRLIEIGAVVEAVYGKAIVKELLPYLQKFLEGQNERGNYFSKELDKGRRILGLDEKEKIEAEEKIADVQSEEKTETPDLNNDENGSESRVVENQQNDGNEVEDYQTPEFIRYDWEPNEQL